MKKNIGYVDRFVRIVLAAIFVMLYFSNILTGAVGVVLLIVSAVFLLTSLVSICPLYSVLGINTSVEGKFL